jgi:hypothetical protein
MIGGLRRIVGDRRGRIFPAFFAQFNLRQRNQGLSEVGDPLDANSLHQFGFYTVDYRLDDRGSCKATFRQCDRQTTPVRRVFRAAEVTSSYQGIYKLPSGLFRDSKFLDELAERDLTSRYSSYHISAVSWNVVESRFRQCSSYLSLVGVPSPT